MTHFSFPEDDSRRTWRFTWQGREVHSSQAKLAVSAFLLVFGLPLLALGLLLLLVVVPLSFPLHLAARALGGRGFWDPSTGKYDIPGWAGILILLFIGLLIWTAI